MSSLLRAPLGPLCLAAALAIVLAASGCGENRNETTSDGGTGGSGGNGASGGAEGGSGGAGGSGGGEGGAGGAEITIGGDRPVKMYVPAAYDGSKPAPLLVLLHGYSASGSLQELYFGFKGIADERGFLYAVPDGTTDASGNKFWNATDACCDFGGTAVDDSAYLSGVIDEIKAKYSVDPTRVYLVGHSNGGFMSYRMACDHADQIAAIASLAGATFADDSQCNPAEPVSVLQIHGTADDTVLYDGGTFAGTLSYPGAVLTTETWATHGGCDAVAADGGVLDLESSMAGEESTVSVYGEGCLAGGHAELWTIPGGSHIPGLAPGFGKAVFDFLEAHPKTK
jgi:polyhydroxybutyrate depolymerase